MIILIEFINGDGNLSSVEMTSLYDNLSEFISWWDETFGLRIKSIEHLESNESN